MVSSADLRLAVGEVCARVADAGQSSFRELAVLRKLLRWIIDNETRPLNASAVADIVEVDSSTVRRYVQRLVDAGVVVEVPAWRPGVMTRERRRSGFYFDEKMRIAAKIDAKHLTPGKVARSLAPHGGIKNYVQGDDIAADLIFAPTRPSPDVELDRPVSDVSNGLPPALRALAGQGTPVSILIVDLAQSRSDTSNPLSSVRNRASRISSFFYRTSTRVAVLAALPAISRCANSVGVSAAAGAPESARLGNTGSKVDLILHQPSNELVPAHLTVKPEL